MVDMEQQLTHNEQQALKAIKSGNGTMFLMKNEDATIWNAFAGLKLAGLVTITKIDYGFKNRRQVGYEVKLISE